MSSNMNKNVHLVYMSMYEYPWRVYSVNYSYASIHVSKTEGEAKRWINENNKTLVKIYSGVK